MANMKFLGFATQAVLLAVMVPAWPIAFGQNDEPGDGQTQPAINNSDKAADFTAPGFGTLTGGPGKPSADTESWCQFR
ncbi:MAG: hypothetical protein HQ546_11230, partial [Planctomycetes bacterium]|nr:hypothetical protein [Planctomycetota bacterium]